MTYNEELALRDGEEEDSFFERIASWDSQSRLVVSDSAAIEKARKKGRLSHSTATRVLGCPAKHLAETILPRTDSPLDPGPLGNDTHEVLENLYALPKRQRTRPKALELIEQQYDKRWKDIPNASEEDLNQWNEFVTTSVLNIWNLEDPKKVDVVAVELAFKGTQLPNGIEMVGFIDRVDRAADGTLQIRDYKTGKYRKHNPRFGPDEKHHQLRNYAACVEKELGEKVSDAKLLFTAAEVIDDVSIKPMQMQKTFDFYEKARGELDAAAESGIYKTKPSGLCGWCPLARSCPAAQVETEKAVGHANEKWPVYAIPSITNNGKPTADTRRVTQPEGKENDMATKKSSKQQSVVLAPEVEGYDAIGAMATSHFATSYILQRREGMMFDDPSKMIVAIETFGQAVAAVILRVQDQMVGEQDWSTHFNRGVRSMVYTLIEQFPPPVGKADVDELEEYFTRIEKQSVFLLTKGVELLQNPTDELPSLEALAS